MVAVPALMAFVVPAPKVMAMLAIAFGAAAVAPLSVLTPPPVPRLKSDMPSMWSTEPLDVDIIA